MIRVSFVIAFYILPLFITAQHKFYGNLDSRFGYKYNIFNVHKKNGIDLDNPLLNPVRSGSYTNVGLNLGWRLRKKQSNFTLSGTASQQFFFQNQLANSLNIKLNASYTQKFKKGSNLSYNLNWSDRTTGREEFGTYIFNVPRGFNLLSSSLKYRFKFAEFNTINVSVNYRKQKLDPIRGFHLVNETRQAQFGLTRIIGETKKYISAVLLSYNYQERSSKNYTKNEPLKSDNLISERFWRYLTVSAGYRLRLFSGFQVESTLALNHTQDLSIGGRDFRQLTPSIRLNWAKKKIGLKLNISQSYKSVIFRNGDIFDLATLKHSNVTSSFHMKFKKGFQLTPIFVAQAYKNILDKNQNYKQIVPSLASEWLRKKFRLKLSISYTFRSYSNRFIHSSDNQLLRHKFFNGSLSMNYRLSRYLNWSSTLNIIDRDDNVPHEYAASFHTYNNTSADMGILYRF